MRLIKAGPLISKLKPGTGGRWSVSCGVTLKKHLHNSSKMFFFKSDKMWFKKTSHMSGSMSGDLRNCQVSYLGIKISSSSALWPGKLKADECLVYACKPGQHGEVWKPATAAQRQWRFHWCSLNREPEGNSKPTLHLQSSGSLQFLGYLKNKSLHCSAAKRKKKKITLNLLADKEWWVLANPVHGEW